MRDAWQPQVGAANRDLARSGRMVLTWDSISRNH